jgi:small subunit ribosomal protein S2
VDFIIPGNDDSLKAIKLYSTLIADAVNAGRQKRKADLVKDDSSIIGSDSGKTIKVKRLRSREDDEG